MTFTYAKNTVILIAIFFVQILRDLYLIYFKCLRPIFRLKKLNKKKSVVKIYFLYLIKIAKQK